jgi:Flp pilus assembly protein TadG
MAIYKNRGNGARGAALIELAISLPVLLLILVGTIDFARVFHLSMMLNNAVRAGAQYGAQDFAKSGDTSGMQAAANASALADGQTIEVPTPTRTCECASNSNPSVSTVNCSTGTCSTGQHMVVTVSVTARKTFTINAPIPLGTIPRSFTVSRTATQRAQ